MCEHCGGRVETDTDAQGSVMVTHIGSCKDPERDEVAPPKTEVAAPAAEPASAEPKASRYRSHQAP